MINVRMAKLRKELELVRAHRMRQRTARRKSAGLPVISLVGYTNAGKSTLLNALTGANALAVDELFATLDPVTRKANLEGLKLSPEVLITDTVGFVQNLPTQLVAAFRATLEEVNDADALLHVVDASIDKELMWSQVAAVDCVLEQIGASGKPTILVLNKMDAVDEDKHEELLMKVQDRTHHECVTVSGLTKVGVDDVGSLLDDVLQDIMVPVEALIPYSRGDLLSALYTQGTVEGEDFVNDGTHVSGRAPMVLAKKLRPYYVTNDDNLNSVPATEDELWADLAKGRHEKRER